VIHLTAHGRGSGSGVLTVRADAIAPVYEAMTIVLANTIATLSTRPGVVTDMIPESRQRKLCKTCHLHALPVSAL
jgi:hypothetical protein